MARERQERGGVGVSSQPSPSVSVRSEVQMFGNREQQPQLMRARRTDVLWGRQGLLRTGYRLIVIQVAGHSGWPRAAGVSG